MISNLPCNQTIILAKLVKYLFGEQNQYYQKGLIKLLQKSLLFSLSPHSLYQRFEIPQGGISQPMMIMGSKDDLIISPDHLNQWQKYIKSKDYLCQYPQGNYFFHYFKFQLVGREI
jgi:surfactin synthase thioesterase subunit